MKEVLDRHRTVRAPVAVAIAPRRGSRVEPRDPGATMAVSAGARSPASVSGGCVEGAVVQEALAILAGEKERGIVTSATPTETLRGRLTCGGTIRLFVSPWTGEPVHRVTHALRAAEPVALATVVEGPDLGQAPRAPRWPGLGTLGDANLDGCRAGRARRARGGTPSTALRRARGGAGGQVAVFIGVVRGCRTHDHLRAVDFTARWQRSPRFSASRHVCERGAVFATVLRFPMADEG